MSPRAALWAALSSCQTTDIRFMFATVREAQERAATLRAAGVPCSRDRDCVFVPRSDFERGLL